MKKAPGFALFLVALSLSAQAATGPDFDRFFFPKTLRVDYFHSGTKESEVFSLDQLVEQPVWAGSRTNLVDTLNLGKYLIKVIDLATNQLIYSRGFCSLYGEWETTDEAARGVTRTFSESALIPFPKRPFQFVIAKRDAENHFRDVFSAAIVPDSLHVRRDLPHVSFAVEDVMVHGDPATKVDILILGDGYSRTDLPKFRKDVRRFVQDLFDTSPFRERKKDFNVRAVEVISAESGIDEPTKHRWRDNALGCTYNSFGTPRYVLCFDNKTLRNVAAVAPYDALILLVNSGRYGGGGIFNLYAVCYSGPETQGDPWWPDYVFVHEFGHSFAGLADEYYSSNVSYVDFYPKGVEPWEPNITALLQPGHVKWQDLVEPGTPLPTPWNKARYDSLAAAKRRLNRQDPDYKEKALALEQEMQQLLRSEPYWGKVGAFEGAGYVSTGLYRPFLDCRMFSKSLTGFCPVCIQAIERVIDFLTE